VTARDLSNNTVLHPPEIPGSLHWYKQGCRCDGCRRVNADAGMRRRKRIALGLPGQYELIPNTAARNAVIRMRMRGMVWDGMQELVGTDRRDLQRILSQPVNGKLTRRMEAMVLAGERRLEANPALLDVGKRLFEEGPRVRWMIGCLLARGWDSQWIGEQVGWTERLSVSTLVSDWVRVDLWARVEGVFKAHHESWGPSRMSAVRAWRQGRFVSDCYDWEADDPDFRPIPGTLHPELVAEACIYKDKWKHRGKETSVTMHKVYGQWENEPCAAAAMRTWAEAFDTPIEGGSHNRACGLQSHQHDVLPAIWRDDEPPA